MDDLQKRIQFIRMLVQSIQGWIADEAGAVLYQLAREYSPNGVIVELGSWKGRSTTWLAYGAMDRASRGHVYCVDTWKGSDEPEHEVFLREIAEGELFREFNDNMLTAGVRDYVTPLRGDTVSVSRLWEREKRIGLLFIDAAHDYTSVRADFEYWSPFVEEGGFIVFDDVPTWPGPTLLVSQLPHWFRQVAVSANQWIVQRIK